LTEDAEKFSIPGIGISRDHAIIFQRSAGLTPFGDNSTKLFCCCKKASFIIRTSIFSAPCLPSAGYGLKKCCAH
ncbi:MAG: hypothetical protein WCY05_02350, partial [Candidatus Omnitrophota bacterium]